MGEDCGPVVSRRAFDALEENHVDTLQDIEGHVREAMKELDTPQAKSWPPAFYARTSLKKALEVIKEATE